MWTGSVRLYDLFTVEHRLNGRLLPGSWCSHGREQEHKMTNENMQFILKYLGWHDIFDIFAHILLAMTGHVAKPMW